MTSVAKQEREERTREIKKTIEAIITDPFVVTMAEELDATVVPESIAPVEKAPHKPTACKP